jgi:hypothetical protein
MPSSLVVLSFIVYKPFIYKSQIFYLKKIRILSLYLTSCSLFLILNNQWTISVLVCRSFVALFCQSKFFVTCCVCLLLIFNIIIFLSKKEKYLNHKFKKLNSFNLFLASVAILNFSLSFVCVYHCYSVIPRLL